LFGISDYRISLQIFCIDIKPRERRERGKEREKEEFFEEGERAEWKQGDTAGERNCEGERKDRRLNQEREERKREGWEGGES
jgi:hypothetical protein